MANFVKQKKLNVVYFLFTLVFFAIQLRLTIDAIYYTKFTMVELFLCLISLKVGELVNEIIVAGTTRFYAVVGALSLPAVLFSNGIFLPIGCFVFGLSFMKVRDMTIKRSSKRVKFTARAIGFILSPILPYYILIALGMLATCVFLSCRIQEPHKKLSFKWYESRRMKAGNWSMGLHHFHYFSYAYSVPLIYQMHTNVNPVWLGIVFYVGWAAYNAYERFVRPSWILILIGHMVAALSLIMMGNSHAMIPMTFWWFITGLGGGTVYMIHPLIHNNGNSITELKISEGIGHVVGILTWGGAYYFFGVKATFLTGALGGVVVGLIALYKIISLRKNQTEGII